MAALEVEHGLISAVLKDPESIGVVKHVNPDDFEEDHAKDIWAIFLMLYNQGLEIDPVSVVNSYRESDRTRAVQFLGTLKDRHSSTKGAETYAALVIDSANARRASQALYQASLMVTAGSKPNEALSFAQSVIEGMAAVESLPAYKDQAIQFVDRLQDRMNGSGIIGVSTGFKRLDNAISGLRGKHLTLIAGKAGMGKSTLLNNIALNVAKAGHSVLMVTLEMSSEDLIAAMIAADQKVSYKAVQNPSIDDFEYSGVATAAAQRHLEDMLKANITIIDSGHQTVPSIERLVRAHKTKFGKIDLLTIDYLQLLSTDNPNDTEYARISSCSRGLKLLAQELDIPILCAAQLNRANEGWDKPPVLSDLRGSGSLEQDASEVIFIHRPEYYEANKRPGEADFIVAKNRHGARGTLTVLSNLGQARFIEVDDATLMAHSARFAQ